MAKITSEGVSNFDQSKELSDLTSKGRPIHWPPFHRTSDPAPNLPPVPPKRKDEEGGEEPSAGTSSSTSESKPDTSGSKLQETQASLLLPAPDAENPSSAGPVQGPAPSSTASSTSGSGQGTGSDPAHQQASSGEATSEAHPGQASEETPEAGGFTVLNT